MSTPSIDTSNAEADTIAGPFNVAAPSRAQALISAIRDLEDPSSSTSEDLYLSGHLSRDDMADIANVIGCCYALFGVLAEMLPKPVGDVAWFDALGVLNACQVKLQCLGQYVSRAPVKGALELSTGHLAEEVAEGLVNSSIAVPMTVMMNEYGFLVNTVWRDQPGITIPPSLKACLDYAIAHGCSYIVFDRDVPRIDALPAYDW